MATVVLRSGRVKPIFLGHPWVFAQAIAKVEGAPAAGDSVAVRDPKGNFLGRGFYSPKSAIAVRILTRHEDETLDALAIAQRIEAAAALRGALGLPDEATTGYRLINAEGDRLPGLIVDRFGDVAVMQIGTAGMRRHRDAIAAELVRVTGVESVIAAAVDQERDEGFVDEEAVLRGPEPSELRDSAATT